MDGSALARRRGFSAVFRVAPRRRVTSGASRPARKIRAAAQRHAHLPPLRAAAAAATRTASRRRIAVASSAAVPVAPSGTRSPLDGARAAAAGSLIRTAAAAGCPAASARRRAGAAACPWRRLRRRRRGADGGALAGVMGDGGGDDDCGDRPRRRRRLVVGGGVGGGGGGGGCGGGGALRQSGMSAAGAEIAKFSRLRRASHAFPRLRRASRGRRVGRRGAGRARGTGPPQTDPPPARPRLVPTARAAGEPAPRARNSWCVSTQFFELARPLYDRRRPSRARAGRARDSQRGDTRSRWPMAGGARLCVGGRRTRASGPACARRARSSFAARRGASRSTRRSGAARTSTASSSNPHVVLYLPARTRGSSVVSM